MKMEIIINQKGSKIFLILFLVTSFTNVTVLTMKLEIENSAFNINLYKNALDAAECKRQLSQIRSDSNMRLQYAGLRIPKFISQGNTLDMGNYHGCLGIHQALDDSTIQGKYCMINVQANQKISFPEIPELPEYSQFSENLFQNSTLSEVKDLKTLIRNKDLIFREITVGMSNVTKSVVHDFTNTIKFRMTLCIPRPCTISEGLIGLYETETAYELDFCRLPNDKPWAPADYVAIALFSVIGILTVLSTLYDLCNQFILQKDPKLVNLLYASFSVYKNSSRLTTFRKDPNALQCVDGIRALSMTWIIVFHAFAYVTPVLNVNYYHNWKNSWRSIWISSAPLAVDTFFMMSGMLLVYTNAGKITGRKLVRNLHFFYLNRMLRLLPLLAAAILMQASFFHWMSDGPLWQDMASATDECRNYWWLNMLYVNNFFEPSCFLVSWYLAVDMQLHILSPILLYFVLSGSKRQAWAALAVGLLTTLTASTVYVFMKQLPASFDQFWRFKEMRAYLDQYYFNTLPRAPPFLIGLIFGYILHLCRQQKPKYSKSTALILWCLIIAMGSLSLYSLELTKDVNHDSQIVDSLVDAFSRSIWAIAVATLVVLCLNGYGGPVNWFLSFELWKLLSRISYAMYLFHHPLILLVNGSYVQPVYFSVFRTLFAFFSVFSVSFIVGFIATLVIELPFSTIFSRLLSGGLRNPEKEIPLPQNNKTAHELQKGN